MDGTTDEPARGPVPIEKRKRPPSRTRRQSDDGDSSDSIAGDEGLTAMARHRKRRREETAATWRALRAQTEEEKDLSSERRSSPAGGGGVRGSGQAPRTTMVLSQERQQQLLSSTSLSPPVPVTDPLSSSPSSDCPSDSSRSSISAHSSSRGGIAQQPLISADPLSGEEADIEQASEEEGGGSSSLPRPLEQMVPPMLLRAGAPHREGASALQHVADPADAFCDVCLGGESFLTDRIVMCDGCDVAIHQSCYGLEHVPEDEWHCSRCSFVGGAWGQGQGQGQGQAPGAPSCLFCEEAGGALKPTGDRAVWCHLGCVFYDHDAYLGDARCMEPVVFRRQPSEERRVACVMCGQARGYSISCRWPGCQRLFHARCAQRSGFVGMSAELGGLVTQAFCDQHRHERVNAHEILASLLAIVDGTPVSPTITAMQGRVHGEDAYGSYAEFVRDLTPILDALSVRESMVVRVTALRSRLNVLKRVIQVTSVSQ